MLVSAIETAAGFWRKEKLPPAEQVRELRPKLAAILVEAGGEDLLLRASVEPADYMGATRKFVDFITQFASPNEELNEFQKALKVIYRARSQALHSGTPVPASMPMSIAAFEAIVRNALLGWWRGLSRMPVHHEASNRDS